RAGVRHVGTNGPFPTRHAAIRVWLVVPVVRHLSPTKNDEEPKISPALTVTPRRPSRTAVLTAVARALHREEPPPWVLDDPLAMGLAGEDGAEVAKRFRTELSNETLLSFTRWVCVRARLPEDIVETAFANGLRQYVILGAGLDSFAYRRTDLLTEFRVFEVDHPASQAWKRQRLKEMGVRPPP